MQQAHGHPGVGNVREGAASGRRPLLPGETNIPRLRMLGAMPPTVVLALFVLLGLSLQRAVALDRLADGHATGLSGTQFRFLLSVPLWRTPGADRATSGAIASRNSLSHCPFSSVL